MKIMYPNKQTAITATSSDPNYPANNLIDNDVPSKLWKAVSGVNTATLTVTIASGSAGIAIFNTNATSATITAKNNAGATVKTETFTLSGTRTYNRAWMEYTQQNAVHSATIALATTAGTTLQAGIVRAAAIVDLPNPQYGLGESRKDHSVILELNDGSYYTKKRNINRTFNLSFIATRTTEYYNFCDIYDAVGPEPLAILLVEGSTDAQWAIFGHMLQPFNSSHDFYSHSNFSIQITEAI